MFLWGYRKLGPAFLRKTGPCRLLPRTRIAKSTGELGGEDHIDVIGLDGILFVDEQKIDFAIHG